MSFEHPPSTGPGSAEAGRVVRASWGELVRLGLLDLDERLETLEAATGFVWRGAWDADTAYNAGDLVSHNGKIWRATGSIPVASPADEPGVTSPSEWELFLEISTALDDLSDVSIGSPLADGDVLTYDTSSSPPAWINAQPSGANTPVIVTPTAGADVSTSSDTTPNNDPALLFAAEANEEYVIDMLVNFTSGTDATIDASITFSVPAGATITWGAISYPTTATTIDVARHYTRYQSVSLVNNGVISTAVIDASPVFIHALVRMSSTAGNVVFQWSQANSSLTALVRKADSYLRYQKKA